VNKALSKPITALGEANKALSKPIIASTVSSETKTTISQVKLASNEAIRASSEPTTALPRLTKHFSSLS